MDDNKKLTKFFVVASIFFIWNTVQGALQAQGPIHEFLEQGPAGMIVGAHVHVGLLGWVSLALIGIFYYMVPLLSGKKLSWPGYVNWVFWISTIVITINHILLILGGISGGKAFKAGMQGPELGELLKPYMIPIGMLSIICGIVYILFAIQIIHTAAKKAS